MHIEDLDARWHALSEEVITGMTHWPTPAFGRGHGQDWRVQHPKATFREIEAALDQRLARLRARMLEDTALVSRAADWSATDAERPVCPQCGAVLPARGQETRTLASQYDQALHLERRYGVCPRCEAGLFPLDEELQLLAGHYTPTLYEGMTRLSTWMPFERAVKEVGYFLHTHVTESTVRRQTEAAGAAYVAVQTHEVERLEHDLPPAPQGPTNLFMSVDGAFVPLVGGEWAEVKTLALGEVMPPRLVKGEIVIQTQALSYFSRLIDATTFQRLALVETHRRGVETANTVGAVTDGAEWCQSFIDFHRSDATRILDFPHAGEHVAQIGQAVFGEGTATTDTWFAQHLHDLKHDGPTPVLADLHHLVADHPDLTALAEPLAYLDKRKEQMQYPVFQAAGWPIGDGAVESANKLVVEARLKGSGMHWARPHVDPMLALRNLACNDRWDEGWAHIVEELRRQTRRRSMNRRQQRGARCEAPPVLSQPTAPASSDVISQTEATLASAHVPAPSAKSVPDKPKETQRPAPNHPWRRSPIGRARYQPTTHAKQ